MPDARMKILLFFASGAGEHSTPPMGLTYIASYMEENGPFVFTGITTEGKDKSARWENPLWSSITFYNPDVIFMTVAAANVANSTAWAKAFKEKFPCVKIVWGGFLATFIPEELLEMVPEVDFIITHEGEDPALALCRILLRGEGDLSSVPSLYWRENNLLKKSGIPAEPFNVSKIQRLNLEYFEETSKDLYITLMLSRGCPVKCGNKLCGGYWGGRFSIISESCFHALMQNIEQRLNVMEIIVQDYLTIPAVKNLLMSVLPEFPQYKFYGKSHIQGFDEDLVETIKKLNFRRVDFYFTPLAHSVAARRCKNISVDNAINAIRLLRKYDIAFKFPVHLATSDETLEELNETLEIIDQLDLRPDELCLSMGTYVQPGSIDYEILLKRYPNLKWFGNDELDDRYFRRYSKGGYFLTYYEASAKYSLSDFSRLMLLPLYSFQVKDAFATGGDLSELVRFVESVR